MFMGKFVMETWVIMTLVLAISCYSVETELISLCPGCLVVHSMHTMIRFSSSFFVNDHA